MENFEIYCPKCRYRPASEDRWLCEPGCGTSWNTFWTGGLCPGCAKRWKVTQCPTCDQVSPHRSWYHAPQRSGASTRRKSRKVPTA